MPIDADVMVSSKSFIESEEFMFDCNSLMLYFFFSCIKTVFCLRHFRHIKGAILQIASFVIQSSYLFTCFCLSQIVRVAINGFLPHLFCLGVVS